MKPAMHVITSLSLGAVLWFFTKSFYAGLLCFFSGILMDADHAIEYVIHHGSENFTIKNIYEACEQTGRQEGDLRFKKVYLVFHVGEVVILSWIAVIITKNIYLLALASGWTLHLVLDYLGNPTCPFTYFLSFRLMKKFSTDKVFKNGKS